MAGRDRFGRFNWAVFRPLIQGSLIGLGFFVLVVVVMLIVQE